MAAETGFTIDGEVYELVSMDDLDTDERFILFEYCGIVQEDFLQEEDEANDDYEKRLETRMRHPGWWPAMWHIAYRRSHPELKPAKIKAIIGKTKFVEAMSSLVDEDEVEELDPTKGSTPEPSESSERSSNDSPASSGTPLAAASGGQVVPLAPTTPGSSPPLESAPTVSAG